MNISSRLPRVLLILGLLCMLVGAIDPLEGSMLILPGVGLVTLGAFVGRSRYRKLLAWSFGLVVFGVAALWLLSMCGGLRRPPDERGLSKWWGLLLIPYPVGWIMGVVCAIRALIESFRRAEEPMK